MKNNIDFFREILSNKCAVSKRVSPNMTCDYSSIEQVDIGPAYIFEIETRKIMQANHDFFELLKYSEEDLADLYVDKLIVIEQQEIESAVEKYLNTGTLQTPLRQYRCKDGELLFIQSTVQVGSIDNKQYILVKMEDVTEWQQVQNHLRLAAQVFDSASDGIIVTDMEGLIQFANPAFLQTTGYSLEEVLGQTMRIVKSGKHDDEFYQNMWNLLKTTGQWKGEIWNKRKNGEIYPEGMVIDAIKNELGRTTLYAGILRDLSERMKYDEQIKHQAYHDGLTGLPNRRLFYEKIHECILMAKRYQHTVGIMFVDLDGFKSVNDNFGHDIGDLLLQEVSKRLQQCVRETDIVARMGGDEFTLILPEIVIKADANKVAEQIRRVLHEPFVLNGFSIIISSSIGISIFPDDGDNEELLVKKADDAMYQAKQGGKNTYRVHGE